VAFIINGTLLADGCYGNYASFEAAYTYFADFPGRCFNPYSIGTDCTNPLYISDGAFTAYLNLPAVQAAIHAPSNFNYAQCNDTLQFALTTRDQRSMAPAYFVIPSLLASGVKVNLLVRDPGLHPQLDRHRAVHSEHDIEWGSRLLPAAWQEMVRFSDYAGTWGDERGFGYHLFYGAGHRIAQDKPPAAFTTVRDRIVGNRDLPWY
jgi:carboxypeptidase C (cathepsin A)